MRRGAASIAMLVALVVGAACSIGEALQDPGDPVDMTTDTIAGIWHAGSERFITFAPDGTFTAANLPHDLFDKYSRSPGIPIDASGRYTLDHSSVTTSGPHSTVRLSIDEHTRPDLTVGSAELLALRPGDGQVYLVFFYVGGLGNVTTGYLHCAEDCPPVTGLQPAPYTS